MSQTSCCSSVSVVGICLGGGDNSSGITGTGLANRAAVWTSDSNMSYQNVVIDSSSNLNMNVASAGHVIPRSETYSITSGGNRNPNGNVDISFVTIDDTACTGTLSNGTDVGQTHTIIISSVGGSSSQYNLAVANFQPAGGTAGPIILRFTKAGQSALCIWDGYNWSNMNAGVVIIPI